MTSDRAMWASVALVDYLRNGVPLEDAPRVHVLRSLAAVMNAFRLPLEEYWERQMEIADGMTMMQILVHAGLSGIGVPPELEDNQDAISNALYLRTWESVASLPEPVWKVLRGATGMDAQEWSALPDYCRELLAARIICPKCSHAGRLDGFGEPNPIDDPTYFGQQRVDLTFRCPVCGTEVTYAITSGKAREYHAQSYGGKRVFLWTTVGVFLGLSVLMLLAWAVFHKPTF